MVKLSVVFLWSEHIHTGKEGGLESGGGSGSVLSVVCVGGSAGPRSFFSALRGFFCPVRIPMGSTCVRRR